MSEFDTVEQTQAHLAWLKAKVAASRADGRPSVAHEEAMKRVQAIVHARQQYP